MGFISKMQPSRIASPEGRVFWPKVTLVRAHLKFVLAKSHIGAHPAEWDMFWQKVI